VRAVADPGAPALVNSFLHVDWKGASDSLLHLDASVSNFFDSVDAGVDGGDNNPLNNPLTTSDSYQAFKSLVTLVSQVLLPIWHF